LSVVLSHHETARLSRETLHAVRTSVVKSVGLLLLASVIGVVDDLQVRYVNVAGLGTNVEILYQSCFIGAAAAGAYLVLHRKDWGVGRNLSNLMMAIPLAAIADNVSIDAGTLKPYLFAIPDQGYQWRQAVFGHTVGLSRVADLVNQQSIAPGVLDGYVAAVAIAVGYLVLRYAFYRRDRTSLLGSSMKSIA